MSSSSKNQTSQVSGKTDSNHGNQPSYMLQEYLHAEPTVTEQLSGVGKSKKGKGKKKHREERAKKELKKFDDAWRDASQ
ncbi:hypothetical protein GGR54DRAFT_553218 [Hypoxylon sp. NC1633]|nr:hypothetical protein GGR54DRAFT_553218 [Hypoxylon sp. NC1633]